MLKVGIANSLKHIIELMCDLDEKVELTSKDLSVRIELKSSAMMALNFEDKRTGCQFRKDCPIYVYHNAIARLSPIYNQLAFLEKHPELATPDVCMGFAATMSNVGLMLDEQSLVRTEEQIWEFIPAQYRQDLLVVCGPIGENFVVTVHYVKRVRDAQGVDEESSTLWSPMIPETEFPHRGAIYRVVESVMMKQPMRTQNAVMGELKALQMLLCAIATNLSVEEEDNDEDGV